uniref:6-Cys domain-containing protein n=1 Tax=Babesia bovis TaxID=5865 RepID=A0A0S3J426_BABBO|nr:hypothetical protein [Babesia bovis]
MLCNFDEFASINDHAAVVCAAKSSREMTVSIKCPKLVGDVEYSWHPHVINPHTCNVKAYVKVGKDLADVNLSDVLKSEDNEPIWRSEEHLNYHILRITTRYNYHYVMGEDKLMFLCAPKDLDFNSTLTSYILNDIDIDRSHVIDWMDSATLYNELNERKTGLGFFFMNRDYFQQPLQGCGSRSSSLFLDKQLVDVDADTGVRSCEVDPMSSTPIGFLCEGRMEPPECMKYLIDTNGKIRPNRTERWTLMNRSTLVVAQPLTYLATSLFEGHCLCIDPLTDRVLAKIVVKPRYEYVCDINNMLMKNRVQPIHSFWCSVTLHPGSTLTIRFPPDPNIILSDTTNTSTLQAVYPYETQFKPSTLEHLHSYTGTTWNKRLESVPYHDRIVGDALELDLSMSDRGLIRIIYMSGKPLGTIKDYDSILFHWHSVPFNKLIDSMISASISVQLVPTHIYDTTGCDIGQPSVFNPRNMAKYIRPKEYIGNTGLMHDCVVKNFFGVFHTGIYCGSGNTLMPNGCKQTAYSLYSNTEEPIPSSVVRLDLLHVEGMQMFKILTNTETIFSMSCNCVDPRGFVISRLILENPFSETIGLFIRPYNECLNYRDQHLPYIDGSMVSYTRGSVPSKTIPLLAQHEKFYLYPGTKYIFKCQYCTQDMFHRDNYEYTNRSLKQLATAWIPRDASTTYFKTEPFGPSIRFISANYEDIIMGEKGGLTFEIKEKYGAYQEHLVVTYSRGTILISKDESQPTRVTFYFICGILPFMKPLIKERNRLLLSLGSTPPSAKSFPYGTYKLLELSVETTDPYVHGCGLGFKGETLFRDDTITYTEPTSGIKSCVIDLNVNDEGGFYCPPPYIMEPPECFHDVFVGDVVTKLNRISSDLFAFRSSHFSPIRLDRLANNAKKSRKTYPALRCRCVTITGELVSSIVIINYQSKGLVSKRWEHFDPAIFFSQPYVSKAINNIADMRLTVGNDSSQLYKVLYGQQYHLYYISLYVKPSRSICILDENLRQIRRIELNDIASIQRRILSAEQTVKTSTATYSDIELKLSTGGERWLRFTLPSTEECEALCKSIQIRFGIPVYNYGSLNVNFRAALGDKKAGTSATGSVTNPSPGNYHLVKDEYPVSSVGGILSQLGLSMGDDDRSLGELPEEFTNDYPVIIEGTLESGSYANYRSLKTPSMESFTVYRVEWYISTRRGESKDFYSNPSSSSDMLYLHDYMIGHYIKLRVSKAVGTGVNRRYLYSVTTRGPIRLGNIMAHNVLLNVSKDNELHTVLAKTDDIHAIATSLNRLPKDGVITKGPMQQSTLDIMQFSSFMTCKEVPVEEHATSVDEQNDDIAEPVETPLPHVRVASHSDIVDSLSGYTDKSSIILNDTDTNESTIPSSVGIGSSLSSSSELRSSATRFNESLLDSIEKEPEGSEDSMASLLREPSTKVPVEAPPPKAKSKPPLPKVSTPKSAQGTLKGAINAKGTAVTGRSPVKPDGTPAVEPQVGKMRGLFKNWIDKGKTLLHRKKGMNATAIAKNSVNPKAKQNIHPKAKHVPNFPKAPAAKKAIPMRDDNLIEVQLQLRCAGLVIRTTEIELELSWPRLDVKEYCDPSKPPTLPLDPRSGIELRLMYKRKDSGESQLLPLTLRLSSTLQRSSIDQGEKDLQRGLFSDVKEAYAKICKYMGRRNLG